MFCHKCGIENREGSRYCQACGENITAEDAPLLDVSLIPLAGVHHDDALAVESRENSQAMPVPASMPRESIRPGSRGGSPMKFSTRVAYNILESDRKTAALLLLSLLVLAAGVMAVSSCLGLVSSFAGLSDAQLALPPNGVPAQEIQAGIDRAWRSIWLNLAAIPASVLVFFLGIRLLVRVRRVAETLRKVRKDFD